MVDTQIAGRGIRDPLVLNAMRSVPRELFVDESFRNQAYDDFPLPLIEGQTISQPFIVALMTEALALTAGDVVLEIGTGSGYSTAVLAEIAKEVYTVERSFELSKRANEILEERYFNIHVLWDDGTLGWPEHAPYDAIIVAAGGPQIPDTLKSQLKVGGRLVIPVGKTNHQQQLLLVKREAEQVFQSEVIADVRFVPLIGSEGWSSSF
ncbi:MAG: protein-L-isoaspartate(D-aspartate) O-methyltransferase [Pirellulaceae bacterium]